jgi:hypothetical protein
LSPRNIRAGYQYEDVKVLKALQFVSSPSDPVFAIGRGHSRCPQGVIIAVKHGLGISCGDGRECFVNRIRTGRKIEREWDKVMSVTDGGIFRKEGMSVVVNVVGEECTSRANRRTRGMNGCKAWGTAEGRGNNKGRINRRRGSVWGNGNGSVYSR